MATPRPAPAERSENTEFEALVESFGLNSQINRLNMSLGPDIQRPADDVTDIDLQKWEEGILDRTVMTTFREFSATNEILWRRKAMQHLKRIQEIMDPDRQVELRNKDELQTQRIELVYANQAMTYNQYLPAIVSQVTAFMDLYQSEFQDLLPYLQEEKRTMLQEQYRKAVDYMFELRKTMDERRNFASVRNLDNQISQAQEELANRGLAPNRRQEITKRLEDLRRSRASVFAMLPKGSQDVVNKSMELYQQWQRTEDRQESDRILQQFTRMESEHTAKLDTQLLEILKGNPEGREDVPVPKGFLPQRMYLQAIELQYGQTIKIQEQIARSGWNDRQKADAQEKLSVIRRGYMDNMVAVTQQLAGHHVIMSELTSIQNNFGRDYNLTDARRPEGQTPERTLKEMDKSIDGARDFHLGRLVAMTGQVDTSFNENGMEALTDAGVMELLKGVNGLSGALRNLITAALPEGATKDRIDKFLDDNLQLSIRESLESGVGPDGKPLTKEEKLEKIRDVIMDFKETKATQKFRSTVQLLQGMPDASEFAGQQVANPLPAMPEGGIRSAAARDKLIRDNNGATVYAMLVLQMKSDGEAFQAAYKDFLGKMEDLVDIRLGLIAEVDTIAESWKALATSLSIATGAAAVLPIIAAGVGGTVGVNLLWKGIKNVPNLIRAPRAMLRGVGRGAVGRVGGGALLAYRTYMDFLELGEKRESVDNQRTQMITELKEAGFEADPADQEKTFTYKDGGTEVKVNIEELNEAQQGQVNAQAFRTLASAGQMLAVLRFGVSRTFLPLLAIEVTVETVRYGMDQESDRKFLRKAPAWLIAKINLQEATGESAYSMLAKASGEMMTDAPFGDGENSRENREKRELRQKMFFAILNAELREFPEIRQEIYGGSTHPLSMEGFFDGEFKEEFLPLFYARLFELSGGKLSWDEVRNGQIDVDWNIPLATQPKITLTQIRIAMRECAALYVHHTREQNYLQAIEMQSDLQAKIDALADKNSPEAKKLLIQKEILDDMIKALGEQEVLGSKLSSINRENLNLNGGETRVQLITDYLYENADKKRYTVPASEVDGLDANFSFGEPRSVFNTLIDSPALRTSMQRVLPPRVRNVNYALFSSLFTNEGQIVDIRSHFYDRALIAAIEAATLALPESHDIRELTQQLSEKTENISRMSPAQLIEVRDLITDAVREYSETNGRGGYELASRTLAASLPAIPANRVFYAQDIDREAITDFRAHRMPDNWPEIMVQQVFGKKLDAQVRAGNADIVLFQQIIPEWGRASRNKLNIMTMTCIECEGRNTADWKVHIHRYQTARDISSVRNEVETVADEGNTTTISFEDWIEKHAEARKQIDRAVEAVKIAQGAEPNDEKRREIEGAQGKAARSTDAFVEIPYHDEYRRAQGDGMVTLRELPFVGVGEVPPYRFSYTEGRSTTNFTIHNHKFYKETEKFTANEREIIRDVVTTPIPGKDQESLEGVMHLFGFYFRQKYYSHPEINCYKDMRRALLPLYRRAEDKKFFLERLFDEMRWRGGVMKAKETAVVTGWFRNNMSLFEGMSDRRKKIFSEGDIIINRVQNAKGLYERSVESKSGIKKIYFAFNGLDWLWHPGTTDNPEPKKWYPVSQINIPLMRDGRRVFTSPAVDLIVILRKLNELQRNA
jgi:hypothetical protein